MSSHAAQARLRHRLSAGHDVQIVVRENTEGGQRAAQEGTVLRCDTRTHVAKRWMWSQMESEQAELKGFSRVPSKSIAAMGIHKDRAHSCARIARMLDARLETCGNASPGGRAFAVESG